MRFIISLLLLLLNVTVSFAATSAVNSHSCQKMIGTTQPFILVLQRGENFFAALIQCANDAKLKGASLTGLGTLVNPSLAYYYVQSKAYEEKVFPGTFELISLNGTISEREFNKKRAAHIHAALANVQFQVIGGHLMRAVVAGTAEITIIPFPNQLVKKIDDETALEIITTEK